MLSSHIQNRQLAESILSWWRDAGVDYVTDGQEMNWLERDRLAPVAVTTPEMRKVQPLEKVPFSKPVASPLPATLSELRAAIEAGSVAGCRYGSHCLAPGGEAGATAMILGDFPEEEELVRGAFGTALLKNMLLACGIVPDLTYIAALAHSRPTAASLPKNDLPELAELARHHIALVQPKVVVLFGSTTCEALFGEELMAARGQLRFINHNDRKVAAMASFHPRTLIAQPQLKAQAWKDLQVLVRKDYL